MSVDKYKFISPGVFVSEIDNTGKSLLADNVGPAIIGRSEKGPILQPIHVNSYFDFVQTFGNPIPGGKGGDVVRDGNYTSPTYGAFAAQAWFRNNAPITFIRLGGKTNQNASDTGAEGAGFAGWQTVTTEPNASMFTNGGAYGLFMADTPSQYVMSASIDVDAALLDAGTSFTLLYRDTHRTFLSGTANATEDAQIMTFQAETTPGVGTIANIVTNLTEVINLSSIPISADAGDERINLTASNDLPILEPVGIKIAFKNATADFIVQTYPSASAAAHALATTLTGVMSASYRDVTGTLAAVWYIDQSASIGLSGTCSALTSSVVGSSIYVDSLAKHQFKVQISSSLHGVEVDSAFDFTDTSNNFIRRVFNTNPILTNSDAVATTSNSFTRYWLGESYAGSIQEKCTAAAQIGVILPLISGSALFGGKFRKSFQDAKSGFFFSQDMGVGTSATGSYFAGNEQNLFRLVARNSGDWIARNLKVSIKDIKASSLDSANPYGSFSVVLRKLSDTDNRIEIVEQYNNCNLNPNSEDYIARKIGDKHLEWDDGDRRYRELGEYMNLSKYVWVEVPQEVANADTDSRYLPFGVRGPLRFEGFTDLTSTPPQRSTLVSGNMDDYGNVTWNGTNVDFISGAFATNGHVRYEFPELRLRCSGSEGSPVDPLNSYYGVDTTFNSSRLNPSVRDYLKIKPSDVDDFAATSADHTEISYQFSLDEMCRAGAVSKRTFSYKSGSRQANADDDTLARRDGLTYIRGTGSYQEVLDAGIDRFTTCFHGGFDGFDITESEPLRLVNQVTTLNDVATNYMFNSVQVAIDSLRDPEVVEYNITSMPGVTNNTLNRTLVDMCESRGDSLAVIDLKDGYVPQYESTADESSRRGSVANTINNLKSSLVIDSSYGTAYYPWVQIRDISNGQVVWVPPSVAAIGAMSYSQKASELWFAPAGFTRGGLSVGRAGIPVVGVRDRLTSRDRDDLYENRINPIAQFPAEGIVIFGQKTLAASASALSRINVRRLMIFLKRQISRYAATILFDQNVRVTWNRFKGQVEPFLRAVQAGLGITEFKLVLDEETTTPDLIDRNIMYAKIFIKPARSIEYIAIDFILTDSGAAFED